MSLEVAIARRVMDANNYVNLAASQLLQAESIKGRLSSNTDTDPQCLAEIRSTLSVVSRLLTYEIEYWEESADEANSEANNDT